jgi:hypothetical protein
MLLAGSTIHAGADIKHKYGSRFALPRGLVFYGSGDELLGISLFYYKFYKIGIVFALRLL